MKKFSVIHATYGRPLKAVTAMVVAIEMAENPDEIEYIFCLNEDDPSHKTVLDLAPSAKFIIGKFKGSAPAWDAGAKVATGDILIQMQDDVVPPFHWDDGLLTAINEACEFRKVFIPNTWPLFIAVSDGYRLDGFCFMAIMNRAYYEMRGEFIHPGYISVYSDDDAYFQAKKVASEGKAYLLEARDIIWKHDHHYHNPNVPLDSTYLRENSDKAYAHGQQLFARRCSE
jgi:hypothetical protein